MYSTEYGFSILRESRHDRHKSFNASFWNFLSTFIIFLQQAVLIKWQPFESHTYSGSTQQPSLQTNDSPLCRILAKHLPDKNHSVILSHYGELRGDWNVNASTDLHKKLCEMYQLEHQWSILMWHFHLRKVRRWWDTTKVVTHTSAKHQHRRKTIVVLIGEFIQVVLFAALAFFSFCFGSFLFGFFWEGLFFFCFIFWVWKVFCWFFFSF